jgi:hypothetical protein
MPGILDLIGYVQKQGEAGRERGQQSYLGRIASQAYGAQPDQQRGLVQQAIATNPGAGFSLAEQLQKTGKADFSELGQAAAIFATVPDDQKQQFYATKLAPLAHRIGYQVPETYDPRFAPMLEKLAQTAGSSGDDLKSLRIGANGNYWAIRGGQFVDTGTPAAPNTVVRDQPGVPFDILDKRTGSSIYNQQPQLAPNSAYQTPGGIVRIGDVAPEDMAAVQADISSNGASDNYQLPPRDVSPGAQGGRPQSRPATAPISDYQRESLGIQRDRMQIAEDARKEAAAARKAADDAKAGQKRQIDSARQAEAATASNNLVSAIDTLMAHPGFADLGTPLGDLKIKAPLIRSDAKDADAQLKNIGGQVALSTMARLKALSSQGATGFGALSAPELKLLQNAIATLQSEDISNAQLRTSLKTIRDTVDKVATWQPKAGQSAGAGDDENGNLSPTGGVDDLLGKYGIR